MRKMASKHRLTLTADEPEGTWTPIQSRFGTSPRVSGVPEPFQQAVLNAVKAMDVFEVMAVQ